MRLTDKKRTCFVCKQVNSQDGFVLILTMVMLAILSILGVMVLNTTDTELSITSNSRMNSDAFVASQLALEYSKVKVATEPGDIEENVIFDLTSDPDSDLAGLLPAGITFETTGRNEIDHYLDTATKRKLSSQSADNTTNTYTTTQGGGSQDSPYYRISLEVKARGRTSSRLETVLERVANTSL